MTNKEFRQLKRIELIDIIYEYQKQEKTMQEEINRLKAKLHTKNVRIRDAGSIAEAAMGLTGIFETAQKTADIYLANIEAAERAAEEESEKAIAAVQQIIDEAQAEAQRIKEEAKLEAEQILAEARKQAGKPQKPADDGNGGEDSDDGRADFEYIVI